MKSSAATTAQDKAKSCQASDGKSGGKTLVGNKHRYATVACEQPPKSEVIPPLAKTAAAAMAVLG